MAVGGCDSWWPWVGPLDRRPLLLSEPAQAVKPLRRRLLELSFEAAEAPEAAVLSSAVLGAMACGQLDATVVDVGAGVTSVAPLLRGVMQKEAFREPFGPAFGSSSSDVYGVFRWFSVGFQWFLEVFRGLLAVSPLRDLRQTFAGHALDVMVLEALKLQGVQLPDAPPDGALRLAQDVKETAAHLLKGSDGSHTRCF